MYYPNINDLNDEFSKNALETRQEGCMIEISTKRARALADAAVLYCWDGNTHYIPNGKFSDAEVALFEIMCSLYRAGSEEG